MRRSLQIVSAAVLILGIAVLLTFLSLRGTRSGISTTPVKTAYVSPTPVIKYIDATGETTIELNNGEIAVLPSGAFLITTYSAIGMVPEKFTSKINIDRDRTEEVAHLFRLYHEGYIYEFKDPVCTRKDVWQEDYMSSVLDKCSVEASIQKSELVLTKVRPFTFNFSAAERQSGLGGRETFAQKAADTKNQLLIVSGPTPAISRDVNGKLFFGHGSRWGMSFLTNFGRGSVSYTLEELESRKTKVLDIGPARLTVILKPLTCTAPYLQSSPNCSSTYSGRTSFTYNKLDFEVKYEGTDDAEHPVTFLDSNIRE